MSYARRARWLPLLDSFQISRMSPEMPDTPSNPDFLVQNFVELIGGITMAMPDQIHQDAGIDGAGARAHHEPFERREAHAGVHAFAVRTAVTDAPFPRWQTMSRDACRGTFSKLGARRVEY
jgi:hypothetical protein